jgi:hypothetical protein
MDQQYKLVIPLMCIVYSFTMDKDNLLYISIEQIPKNILIEIVQCPYHVATIILFIY